jgi:hypothetical protein
MAVLLLHHPRKGTYLPGQAARGTGALTAYADIVVEMTFFSKSDRQDRRRRLASWSRHAETPAELIVELTTNGRNYTAQDPADDEFTRVLQVVCFLLQDFNQPLNRAMLLALWPDSRAPSSSGMYNHLERGVALGRLVRIGSGHRDDAFHYGLPGMMEPAREAAEPVADVTQRVSVTSETVSDVPEPVAVMVEPVPESIDPVAVATEPVDGMTDSVPDESDTVLDLSDSVSDPRPAPPPSEPGEAVRCPTEGIDGFQDPDPSTRS